MTDQIESQDTRAIGYEPEWDGWQLLESVQEPRPDERRAALARERKRRQAVRRFVILWAGSAAVCFAGYMAVAAVAPGGWSAGLLLLAIGLAMFVAGLVVEGRRF